MAKFLLFINGVLSTRYDSFVHEDKIPPQALEVNDDLFFQTINEQDGIWSLTNEGEIVKLPFPDPTIDELITKKITEINSQFNQLMHQITAGIPVDEIASWDKQEAEARAYTADNNAVTPLIDALAAARGITKADLAGRIITKADLFATVSGQLIGTRQGLEDQLDALAEDENTTAADVELVVWPS
ncbi:MAG: hypothetical protein ACSHWN_04785 [Methylophilaceae bacterium]